MKRTNIYLTDDELRLLHDRARRDGTTTAHVVREILDRELGLAEEGVSFVEAVETSAGAWSDLTDDELAEMRELRAVWRGTE